MPSSEFMIALVPGIAASLALTLSMISNFWCETIQFPPQASSDLPVRTFGPFYSMEIVATQMPETGGTTYTIGKQCVNLPDSVYLDPTWKTAQAFSIITAIFGGIALFYSCLSPCFSTGAKIWKCVGFTFVFCSIFQGLTLLFLDSAACYNNTIINNLEFYNKTCEWAWGTRTNISAVVFWFVAGALMLVVLGPYQPPERPPPETQTVTYIKNPDGTVSETGVIKGTYIASENRIVEDPEQ